MEEIMQSNSFFIIPLTLAYLTICGLWFFLDKRGWLWEIACIESPKKPWIDMIIGIVAATGILVIGQLFSVGYLIKQTDSKALNLIIWPLNNLIIFSPIFLVLMFRRQGPKTIFLSPEKIHLKLGFGLLASLIGVIIFLCFRGEWDKFSEVLARSIQPETLSNFPAIFFENVALAFLFVRLKWAMGIKWAIGIPAILFALAHVPGSIAEGDPISHIITFFILTGSLTTVILYTAYRSRDIFWLGLVHYLMDVAIKAF